MKRIITPLFIVAMPFLVGAQTDLSLADAITTALNSNHQIQILKNQQEIAENVVNIGNAGLLPSLSVGGSVGGSIQNTELEFAGGIPPTKVDGAQSATIQGNATVNYVLFKGLSGQRAYQRLKLNKESVDLRSRASVEATILGVAQAYYGVLRAQDQVRIARDNTVISKKRYERAEVAQELGSISRNELLMARVDLTSDSSNLLNAELQYHTAIRDLGRQIGTPLDTSVALTPIDIEVQDWSLSQLEQAALTNNATVKNLELQSEIAQKDLQISWSTVFPTVSINGGYGYTNQQSEAGILLSNIQNGWNGSVGISYPLFTGFRNNIERQNAKVMLESSELQLADQKLQLQTDLANAYESYGQSVRVVRFEEQNLASSALNLERSEALLKNGQITSTQFRESQLAHASARVRISNARISMKLNELQIMRLTGQILATE